MRLFASFREWKIKCTSTATSTGGELNWEKSGSHDSFSFIFDSSWFLKNSLSTMASPFTPSSSAGSRTEEASSSTSPATSSRSSSISSGPASNSPCTSKPKRPRFCQESEETFLREVIAPEDPFCRSSPAWEPLSTNKNTLLDSTTKRNYWIQITHVSWTTTW